jgi:hypothetical protein
MPVTIKANSGGGSVTLDAGTTSTDTTLTLPSTTGTVLAPASGILPAANGGTGLAAPGTSGNALVSNGTAWTSAAVPSPAALSTATGSAPSYSARAWVNFDGTTATPSTIRGSGNVSSVTKSGTGAYTVNLTTALPDTNGVGTSMASLSSYAQSQAGYLTSTSAFSIGTAANGTAYDQSIVQVMIIR